MIYTVRSQIKLRTYAGCSVTNMIYALLILQGFELGDLEPNRVNNVLHSDEDLNYVISYLAQSNQITKVRLQTLMRMVSGL